MLQEQQNKKNEIVYPNVELWNTVKRLFDGDNPNGKDENVLKSIYNTEIVNPVKFNSGYYYFKPHGAKKENPSNEYFLNRQFQDFHNNLLQSGIMQKKYMDDFILPPTTMVQFYRSKKVVKTYMPLGMNTKKEICGFDDWAINIQILCINEANRTPQESRDLVIDWAMLLDHIQVSGDIFNKKKIYALVIEDIDIKTVAGHPNVFPIELRCVSSEPEELFLNNQLKEEFFNDKKMADFDKAIKSTDFNNFPL